MMHLLTVDGVTFPVRRAVRDGRVVYLTGAEVDGRAMWRQVGTLLYYGDLPMRWATVRKVQK